MDDDLSFKSEIINGVSTVVAMLIHEMELKGATDAKEFAELLRSRAQHMPTNYKTMKRGSDRYETILLECLAEALDDTEMMADREGALWTKDPESEKAF